MLEIILSFFASIGIVLLTQKICDHFFYRKPLQRLSLFVDLRGHDLHHCVLVLETIACVRKTNLGKASITDLVIVHEEDEIPKEVIEKALVEFDLKGLIIEKYWDYFLF